MTLRRATTAAMACGLALRIGMACWNGLAGPSFGAHADAATFHRYAVRVARGDITDLPLIPYGYAHGLGAVYRVAGESLLLGSLLSCAAWLASALLLLQSMRLLRAGAVPQFLAMAVYAVLPSSVIWTSVTLREPYQLLCVNLAMFAALRIMVARDRIGWLLLLLAIGAGVFLHVVVAMFGVVIAALILFVQSWHVLRPAQRALLVLAVAVVGVGAGLAFLRAFMYIVDGSPNTALEQFLANAMYPARTNYRETATVGGALGLALFVPISLFQYLFEPMPWHVNAWIDSGYLVENLIRAVMIGSAVIALVRTSGEQRRHVAVLLAAYFCLELFWSPGTLNWGTAARHHLAALGLLTAAASAYSNDRPAAVLREGALVAARA